MIMYRRLESKEHCCSGPSQSSQLATRARVSLESGRMESPFEPSNGLEQFARCSEFLCWIEDRVVWPLVISPSLLVGFLTVVLMRRGRNSGF
jgi:hypothetical protein